MGYARNTGETTEQYVDRIRSEAANNQISSGPGGSLIQSAIDQARGFGSGSGGQPQNRSEVVSNDFFAAATQPTYGSAASVATPPTTSNTTGSNMQTAPATQPTSALTQGMDPNEFEKARQSILYNLSNPEFALQNALADKGVPLYNPIIRRGILPLASSLGSAFTVQGAQNPGYGPQTDVAGEFRNFISNALGGLGGGIRGATSSAANSLGSSGFAGSLRDAVNMQKTGAQPTNPFLGSLLSTLYDPQALIGLQSSLSLPNLGPGMTQSLQELQGLNAARGWRQIGPGQGEDFFKYLLGT